MAIKITNTRESNTHVKLLVYGASGVGKTRLCATAPNPIIISSEDRLMSLKKHNLPVIKIEENDDFKKAYELITTNPKFNRFDTICVDSISDIAEKILENLQSGKTKQGNKIHGLAAYGEMAKILLPLIKKFIAIPDKHIYFIAKAEVQKDEHSGMVSWMPFLPGNVVPTQLPYLFDQSFFMQTIEDSQGKLIRVLHTRDNLQWRAKDHSGNLPEKIPAILGELTLTKIFQKTLEEAQKPEPKEEAKQDSEEPKPNDQTLKEK